MLLIPLLAGCRAPEPVHYEPTPIACERREEAVAPAAGKALAIGPTPPSEDVPDRFDALGAAGVTWARVDLPWAYVEVEPGSWQWAWLDTLIESAWEHDIDILATLGTSPEHVRGRGLDAQSPPTDLDAWENFVHAAFDRYGPGSALAEQHGAPGITHWDVWNEANTSWFWAPEANVDDYVELLHRTSEVLRARDPDAVVLLTGLSPAGHGEGHVLPLDFVRGVYERGAEACFDVVSHHPYVGTEGPETIREHHVEPLRALLEELGDPELPLWLTEFGYSVGEVTEAEQADLLARTLEADHGGDAFFWFSLQDWDRNGERFGLFDYEGQPRAALDALGRE